MMKNMDSTLALDACLQLSLMSGRTRCMCLLSEFCSQTFTIRKSFESISFVTIQPSISAGVTRYSNFLKHSRKLLSSFIYTIVFGCFI